MTMFPCAPRTPRVARAGRLRARPLRRSRESGYALIMVLFLVASFIIGSQIVLQHLATQGRRQREQRMIWCGEQYTRAIKLFYRKTGHYPQSLDDLQTGLPGVHFLRIEAYKNPMNSDDGSWRLIYVNPTGQIIGSVRYATLQQMAYLELNGMSPSQPGAAGLNSSQTASSEAPVDDGCGPPFPTALAAGGQNSIGQPSSGQPPNPFAGLQPSGPVSGPVIGGFLTGVGGTEDVCSVAVYHGGRKYLAWEFIWNPILDQARATQQQLGGAMTGGGPPPTNSNPATTTPPPTPGPAPQQNY